MEKSEKAAGRIYQPKLAAIFTGVFEEGLVPMKRISSPEALAILSLALLASATIIIIVYSLLTTISHLVSISLTISFIWVMVSCGYLAHRIRGRLKAGAVHDKVDRRRAIGLYGLTLCTIVAFVTLLPTGSVGLSDYGSLCTFAPIATALTFFAGIWLYCYGERRTRALYATTIILFIGFSGASYWIFNATIPFSQIQDNMVIDRVDAGYDPEYGNYAYIYFNLTFTNPTDLDLPPSIVECPDFYINGSELQHGTYSLNPFVYFDDFGVGYQIFYLGLGANQSQTNLNAIEIYLGNGSFGWQTKLDGANITDMWKSIVSGAFTLRLTARLVGRASLSDRYGQVIVVAAKAVDLLCGSP